MRIAIWASFMPSVIKDYLSVDVQSDKEKRVIIDRVKALIRSKVTTGALRRRVG